MTTPPAARRRPAEPRALTTLLRDIRACEACAAHLPHGPRPVLAASAHAPLLIAGQAPGRKVHESGVPWDDASGERLRDWLGIDRATFYDPQRVALVPMGFCYPGTGRSGDLPPRPECAALWHERLLAHVKSVRLRVVVGQYAQAYHLGDRTGETLTATVQSWREFAPAIFPTPHPSPRNTLWLRRNPWFERELIPELRKAVRRALR